MSAADWIALGSLGFTVEAAVVYGASKAGRIASALERIEQSLTVIAGKVEDHEKRLNLGGL